MASGGNGFALHLRQLLVVEEGPKAGCKDGKIPRGHLSVIGLYPLALTIS